MTACSTACASLESRVKILVVHQYYLAPGEPGGSRFNEFARLWTEAGHHVTVIAGSVSYATGRRAGSIAAGFTVHQREDGIDVWRCHVPQTYNRSYAGRMWAFFGFTLSACVAALRTARPDVVIATSPPLTAAIPGFVAARCRFRPVPWVFEMRDLWPESAITTGVIGRTSVLARLLFALERWACRRASMVNVLTPAFAEDVKARGLVTDEKLCFVPNGADVDAFARTSPAADVRRELGWGTRFVALYAGAHGRANALHQLVDAAEQLRERRDILIVSVGDGPERAALEADARARGLDNVSFIGSVAKERMPAVIAAADAGLAVLQNNPTFRTVYPNKVFDYMACGKPTVLAIDGVARQLACDQANAAVFAEPENGAAIAAAIRQLADAPDAARTLGASGRAWVTANAARPALATRYLGILESLVERPSKVSAAVSSEI
jgi:glycosyltransferase involved in cell wall biosynthesis